MPTTATDPATGKRVQWDGSAWVPLDGPAPAPRPDGVIYGQRPARELAQEARAARGESREDERLRLTREAAARAQAATDPETILATATARARGARDVKRIEDAGNAATEGAGLQAQAQAMIGILNRGAPTGLAGDQRLALGTAVGGALGFLPGIPDADETRELSAFNRVASGLTLENVGQLKGPLSEKELAFIQRLSPSVGDTPAANREAAIALEWAGQRAINYEAALSAWTERLGSPSARNARGQSFNGWWSTWSASRMPSPWSGLKPSPPAAAAPRPRAAAPPRNRPPPTDADIARFMAAGPSGAAALAAAVGQRPRPGPPRRRTATRDPFAGMTDAELQAIADGR